MPLPDRLWETKAQNLVKTWLEVLTDVSVLGELFTKFIPSSAQFLLSVIELLFLSLTVEALQGKMCQNSLPLGVGRSL